METHPQKTARCPHKNHWSKYDNRLYLQAFSGRIVNYHGLGDNINGHDHYHSSWPSTKDSLTSLICLLTGKYSSNIHNLSCFSSQSEPARSNLGIQQLAHWNPKVQLFHFRWCCKAINRLCPSWYEYRQLQVYFTATQSGLSSCLYGLVTYRPFIG